MTATKTAQQAHHHRSTLSQTNKKFKARHATKGSLKQLAKGKLEKDSKVTKNTKHADQSGQKAHRKNQAKQLQAHKAALQASSQKVFSGPNPAPRVISILALSEDIQPLSDVLDSIRSACHLDHPIDPNNSRTITFTWPDSSRSSPSLLQFLIIPHRTPLGQVLSTVSASDFLITCLSAVEECTPWGESTLRAVQALGGPTLGVLGLVCHLDSLTATKETQKTRESLTSFLRYFFPETLLLNRIVSTDRPAEILVGIRSVLAKLPNWASTGRPIGWREGRGRLIAQEIDWEDGTLKVTGYVRGGRFSANRLVHLPFLGDFRLSRITMAQNGQPVSVRVDGEADDLVSENIPSSADELMAEQTWPTEEEIASAPVNQQRIAPQKKARRVPLGTSEYQAAWIIDEDGEDHEDDEDEDRKNEEEMEGDDEFEKLPDDQDDQEEMEDLDVSNPAESSKNVHFMDLSDEAEQADLAQYRADRQRERERAAKEDEEFPDEIDTPLDVPARQRFARYRGMKSFRTSEWDPYENLPIEYGKTFAFQGWKAMGRKLAQKANELEPGAGPGMYVTLHLEQFPLSDFEALTSSSSYQQNLVVFSLLKHEHKLSVMHFTTQRSTEFEEQIKSKDELIICVGFRFYQIRPIWSQPSVRATNNVHKFERFLRPGKLNIGSVYLPVTFGSTTPVLVFKSPDHNEPTDPVNFVGNGTLIGSEPRRIVAKRIILTGHPYKVHKKTATIRYMFFNREDIEYFKPIELKTKKGKTGHIKEPLGTHGYLKAKFDGMIDQMDTICLSLYKRCFPKWSSTKPIGFSHPFAHLVSNHGRPNEATSASGLMAIDN